MRTANRGVESPVEMVLDAAQRYDQPLTEERLFAWHASLVPARPLERHPGKVGAWRDDRTSPKQVVSGSSGRERVFEAPAAARLEGEMRRFLDWLNDAVTIDPVLKAAQAHLWFVALQPFDRGNGRIARTIADMMLARSDGSAQRFYSVSEQIGQERSEYDAVLAQTLRGTIDITPWMVWFIGCFTRAIDRAEVALSDVIAKARRWDALRDATLNDRQRLVIRQLLEGFEGNLTTSKWAALAKSSPDTALRDIHLLLERGVLVRSTAGGRSTSYSLAEIDDARLHQV